MNELIQGIHLFIDEGISDDRIALSSGSMNLKGGIYQNIDYGELNAFRQRLPWRAPSKNEVKRLSGVGRKPVNASDIGLLKLPETLFREVRTTLRLDSVVSKNELSKLFNDERYFGPIQKILLFLEQYYILSTDELVINRIGMNKPGLPIVSYNSKRAYFPGLHIDSWDQLPLRDRDRARNRICLNLGREPRYLLFVNLTVQQVVDLLDENIEDPDKNYNPKTLVHHFLKIFPDYPLVRLTLWPGEGYIAPTENIIHDGSTEGTSSPDFYFTLRGFFACTRKSNVVSS